MGNKLIYIENNKLKINKRRLKITLIAIIIIFLSTYLLAEIMVRLVSPKILYNGHNVNHPAYVQETEYDKELGWSTIKNYRAITYTHQGRHPKIIITHNSKGFRMDHEVSENKKLIAITGDSFAYGFNVDDKTTISAKLNELLGMEYEVINLGVRGYGTDQSFLRFIKDALQYKPKVVIHIFYNNDFSNIVSNYQYNLYKPLIVIENNSLKLANVPVPMSDGIKNPKPKEHEYKGFDRFMRSWSHFYILYKHKISKIKSIFKKQKEDYFKAYKDGQMWSVEREYSNVMNYAFNLNSLIIEEYNRIANENNITFVLVLMPDRVSIDPNLQRATIEHYSNVDINFFDFYKPYYLLENFAKSKGIKILNLYQRFKEEYQQNKRDIFLFDGDPHLNDYGNELFAKELHKYLAQQGLV